MDIYNDWMRGLFGWGQFHVAMAVKYVNEERNRSGGGTCNLVAFGFNFLTAGNGYSNMVLTTLDNVALFSL